MASSFLCTVRITEQVRSKRPEVRIIMGGPHASILHKSILQRFDSVDIVIRHEAEDTLTEVLERIDQLSLEGIPGVSYRRDSHVVVNEGKPIIADLDSLPFPAFDAYPIEGLALETMRVEAGRGCPFRCDFCSTASFFGRNYRLKSAERLRCELMYLRNRYGVSSFKLSHDLFTVNKKKVREFCDAVLHDGFEWTCSARVDCVDEPLLRRMSDAGCRGIFFGIESGSERMQERCHKNLDVALVRPTVEAAVELGISPTVSFITGFPDERPEDQQATLGLIEDLIIQHGDRIVAQLHLLTPEPGTPYYSQYADLMRYDGHVTDFTFKALTPEDDDVLASAPDLFSVHHYYPTQLSRDRLVDMTEAFAALQGLSYSVLRHILAVSGWTLNELMSAVSDRYRRKSEPQSLEDTVVEFLRLELGSDHYVVSLARYLYATRDVHRARRGDALKTSSSMPERNSLFLVDTCRLLVDIHYCPPLLDTIKQRPGDLVGAEAVSEVAGCDCIILCTKRGATSSVRLSKSEGAVVRLLLCGMDAHGISAATGGAVSQADVVFVCSRLSDIGALSSRECLQGA